MHLEIKFVCMREEIERKRKSQETTYNGERERNDTKKQMLKTKKKIETSRGEMWRNE